jgi:hypothetical protein
LARNDRFQIPIVVEMHRIDQLNQQSGPVALCIVFERRVMEMLDYLINVAFPCRLFAVGLADSGISVCGTTAKSVFKR